MSDVTELNRAHFDSQASTYDSKFEKTISQLTSLFRAPSNLEFIGANWVSESSSDSNSSSDDDGDDHESKSTPLPPTTSSTAKQPPTLKLLDYACGTGLITRTLLPHITRSIGIDLSPNMVATFNQYAFNQGIGRDEMVAYVGDLLVDDFISTSIPGTGKIDGKDARDDEGTHERSEEEKERELWDFDLVVTELAFHHFSDPSLAARKLAQRLKKGGVFCIVDFETHEPFSHHSHSHSETTSHSHPKEEHKPLHNSQHTVTHHGFSLEQTKEMFEQAGVGLEFRWKILGKGVLFAGHEGNGGVDRRRSVFIARGVKV